MRKSLFIFPSLILAFLLAISVTFADGTETLGDPSIEIASGSGVVAAGTGLQDVQPGTINIFVPGAVQQALIYWGGAVTSNSLSDGSILVDGTPVIGTDIGGPAFFFSTSGKEFYYSNYRADITTMVSSGANSFEISGLNNKDAGGHGEDSGAGILVIYDDGSGTSQIGIKDGLDLAFDGFTEPRKTTVPQTFTFAPAATDQTGNLVIFAGSVGTGGNRTNLIKMETDIGTLPDVVNKLASVDGNLWDTLSIPVTIPAGASQLTVQVVSGDGVSGVPASVDWVGAGLSIPPSQPAIHVEKYTLVLLPGGGGGDLCDTYGKPQLLTMRYTGDNVNDNSQDPRKVVISGDPLFASPVYIVASEKDNGGGKVYFDGVVNLDEDFVIDATLPGDTELRADTRVTVYDLSENVLQSIKFHTSCSQPLEFGDQFGSIQLVGFQDKNGGGETPPDPTPGDIGEDADVPTGPIAAEGDGIQWTYLVTNPGDVALSDIGVVDDNGTPDDPSDDFAAAPVEEGGFNVGDSDSDGLLDIGEEWRFQATGTAQLGQYANLGKATGTFDGAMVMDTDPSHYIGTFPAGDPCDVLGKPAQLTMVYTGNNVISHSQDPSKVVVDPLTITAPATAYILATDKANPDDAAALVYFSWNVNLGDSFVLDATVAGLSRFKASTHVYIFDSQGGTLLQSIEFHTSCSQPLHLGDEFGNIQLVGFVEEGAVPGGGGDGVILDSFSFKDKELKVKLTNTGSSKVTILQVDITFPEATNGLLMEIKKGRSKIYDPPGGVSSPAIVLEGDWEGNVDKREIDPDKTNEYKFKFENNVLADLTAYEITIYFSDATSLAIGG
jgi:hypothetical protein